jgi:Fur family ferric uptake transcriptional regulator
VTLERPAVNRERLRELPDACGGRRVRDNQHRLICRRCGRTEEVGCANDDQPCLTPVPAAGFTVDEAEVVFLGLCPACAAGPAGSANGG